ncbi:hypothetical protein OIU85_006528 [Salix viminalis]|uniref:Uncharacterized protein n=1 Tax=Salix viminalis TaxID=40686 RepID=A0A9Q0SV58_SALVM|nr:hypothetical protein OIU85_006528 [Salix viminalis]
MKLYDSQRFLFYNESSEHMMMIAPHYRSRVSSLDSREPSCKYLPRTEVPPMEPVNLPTLFVPRRFTTDIVRGKSTEKNPDQNKRSKWSIAQDRRMLPSFGTLYMAL